MCLVVAMRLLEARPRPASAVHSGQMPSTAGLTMPHLVAGFTRRLLLAGHNTEALFFWQVVPDVLVYKLRTDGCAEDDEGEDGVPSFVEWELPNRCAYYAACSLHITQPAPCSACRCAYQWYFQSSEHSNSAHTAVESAGSLVGTLLDRNVADVLSQPKGLSHCSPWSLSTLESRGRGYLAPQWAFLSLAHILPGAYVQARSLPFHELCWESTFSSISPTVAHCTI